MNIYHITQNTVNGNDTYSDMVVIANTEEEAKNIHPDSIYSPELKRNITQTLKEAGDDYTWPTSVEDINATIIGVADDTYTYPEVICTSFHAG